MLPELQNIIAEYTFTKKCYWSPLARLGVCLRSCNTTYRKTYTAIVRSEIKNNHKIITFKARQLNADISAVLFSADYGIFLDVEHVDLSLAVFDINLLRVLPSTLKTLCLDAVRFTVLDEFLYLSHLVNLTSLSLARCEIDNVKLLNGLAKLPFLGNLTKFCLRGDPIAGAAFAELANAEQLSKLTSLVLSSNGISDKDVQLLAQSQYMANLTSLDLSCNQIGNASLTCIASSSYFANLTELILNHHQQLGDEGIMELARSINLQRLTKLGIRQCSITAYGLMVILGSEQLTSLSSLDLEYADLGCCDGATLGSKPSNLFISSVTFLNLSKIRTENVFLPIIVNRPLLMNLSSLDLSECYFLINNIDALARSPFVRNITYLNLSGNEVTDDLVNTLAESSNFSKLTTLNLSYNDIEDEGLITMSKSPFLSSLIHLDLSYNWISTSGASYLTKSNFCSRLKKLNLLYNEIDELGLQDLIQSVKINRLRNLELEIEPQNI